MIAFEDRGTQVVLTYESDQGIVSWIDEKLRTEGEASLSRTFTVRPADRLLFGDDDNEDARVFVIGDVEAEYRIIRKDVLGLRYDLRIVTSIALIPRPTPLPGDVTGWLETFAESFSSVLPEGERAAFLAEVQDALRPDLCDDEGRWTADYVRLRFAATKPAA